MKRRRIIVKRAHGIGNVLMLLPVLDHLAGGADITLITATEWVDTISAISPKIRVTAAHEASFIDLDVATKYAYPAMHRTTEFARLLGVDYAQLERKQSVAVPEEWRRPFASYAGLLGFGPEAGHASRQWPIQEAVNLISLLPAEEIILLGKNRVEVFPQVFADLRGKQSLQELFGVVSVLRAVISLDSGLLHIAGSLGVPIVALFGGIDPSFRILPDQPVRAIRLDLACSPCNKNEICNGRYECMAALDAEFVLSQIRKGLPVRREIVTKARR